LAFTASEVQVITVSEEVPHIEEEMTASLGQYVCIIPITFPIPPYQQLF